MMAAQEITRALGGKWLGHYGVACCPAHEDRNPSLSLSDGHDGKLLLKCHAGCGFSEIVTALRSLGIVAGQRDFVPIGEVLRRRELSSVATKRDRSKIARSIWRAALPIEGSLAERYLRGRGITCALPASLRYLADCWHAQGSRPALLASVTGSDGFAVHRTYLAADGSGKSAVRPAKAMLGPTRGGAVWLSNMPGPLVVAEGIETAMSLMCGFFDRPVSVVAALSAGGMAALRLPDEPGRLIIAPDGDRPGQSGADTLAHRAHTLGWEVSILAAPGKADWNDVLMGKTACA